MDPDKELSGVWVQISWPMVICLMLAAFIGAWFGGSCAGQMMAPHDFSTEVPAPEGDQ